jgi:hypothetical protein
MLPSFELHQGIGLLLNFNKGKSFLSIQHKILLEMNMKLYVIPCNRTGASESEGRLTTGFPSILV